MNTKKLGRPTKFNETVSAKIIELAEAGKTDDQIAEVVDISVRTLRNWKHNKPYFLPALKEAKDAADGLVEASLFHSALAGNVTAQIFWLKNRRPHEWGDRYLAERTEATRNTVEVVTTPQEFKELLKDGESIEALETVIRALDKAQERG